MSAATIIFTDIVEFSKKSTHEQKRLIDSLTGEVANELRSLLNPPLEKPGIIALPTGDGMALGLLHQSNDAWDRETILGLVLKLHQWAYGLSTEGDSVRLRIGVHVGAVQLITDINGSPNICGNTINYAQRVMDAAGPQQTLLSEAAFKEYVGDISVKLSSPLLPEDVQMSFDGPTEVFAKHDLLIPVYSLKLDKPYCSNEEPQGKELVRLSLTPLPKDIVGSFSDNIAQAKDIAFIQYTGNRLLERIDQGKIKFSDDLKRLWIFMPAPQSYQKLRLASDQAKPELVKDCVAQWRQFLKKLKADRPGVDIKLGLFEEPPYLGASFIDWDRPKGAIHVSPNVWNVAATKCPGYDLSWIGQRPSDVYEAYVDGLNYLHQTTFNELIKTDNPSTVTKAKK